jgi:hypothetical protein
MCLIPSEDEGVWIQEQAAAEDAGAAVAYALRCRQNGRSQEAAWSARRSYEALDHYVATQENIDMDIPGAEARVLAHPLVQAELAHQRRDLDDLANVDEPSRMRATERLRRRAEMEGSSFRGPAS